MAVRDGKFVDIPVLMALLEEGHANSKYTDFTIDKNECKQILMGALQRTQVKGEGGTCVFVYDDDGIQGFIIGITERIYHIAKEFMATDIFFYIAKEYNDPMAFRLLLKEFEQWAWSNPRVKKIDLGVTNIIGEPRRLAVVYKRFGYSESGLMVEKYRPETF